MVEALEIRLEDVKEWLEQETISIVEPLRGEGRRLLDDAKGKIDDVLETSEKLLDDAEKEIAKGSRKTYRRAKVMSRLARNISDIIDEIIIPDKISQESLQTFCEELEKSLGKISRERAKWFPVISPFFIIDRRRFDVALKRSLDSLQELRSFSSVEYEKAKAVEDAFYVVDKLHQSLAEWGELEARRKKMELGKGVLEKKITENQRKITTIRSQSEIVELVQVDEKVEELRREVKHSLRHLQKPFLKFQSLVQSPSYSLFLDETKKLDEYLTDPFEAFATEEEEYPMLKKIIRKVDDAIVQKKLKLKRSRLRKAKDQIDNILDRNALLSLHQNCKEIFLKKQRLSTSGTIAKSRDELAQVQKNLKTLQKRRELLGSRDAILEGRIKETFGKIEDQKSDLEKIILELTNKKVQVLLHAKVD